MGAFTLVLFPLLLHLADITSMRCHSQVAKGLVVRSDQRGYDFVLQILDLFRDPVLSRDAATALGVIAEESDRVLSKENFAVLRVSCR